MTVRHAVRNEGQEHASAVRRLASARSEEARLAGLFAAAGTPAGSIAQHRLSAGRAYVASREQWLHWIEEGESLAPWEDGEWAPKPPMEEQRCLTIHHTEPRDRAGAVR